MQPDPCARFGIDPKWYGVEQQDLVFLGQLVMAHPEWPNLIDFGCYTGLTTLFMGLLVEGRGQVVSFDQAETRPLEVQAAWMPHMLYCIADLLPAVDRMADRDSCESTARYYIKHLAPCLVVMDNGNKPEEVRRYAPIIPVGSAFVVHDFGSSSKQPNPTGEVDLDDIRETLETYHYEPVMHAEAEALRTKYRCWRRA